MRKRKQLRGPFAYTKPVAPYNAFNDALRAVKRAERWLKANAGKTNWPPSHILLNHLSAQEQMGVGYYPAA